MDDLPTNVDARYAWLLDRIARPGVLPSSNGRAPDARHETHVSIVFLAGDRAWKLRKPVRLRFLDFSTLEARERDAREEWRLNRRLAPDIYIGVRAVVRRDDDVAVVNEPASSDEVLDWLVEMKRLPAAGMLDRVLSTPSAATDLAAPMEAFAQALAAFHGSERPVDLDSTFGTLATLERRLNNNLDGLLAETTRGTHPALPAAFVVALAAGLRARFAAVAPTLLVRRNAGRVRDGHGDLHARNLCVTDGKIVAYDCLEFDANLRIGDVATDVGFLTMDLDVRGHSDLAARFVDAYVKASGDEGVRVVERFFRLHYAVIRTFVDGIRVRQMAESDPERRPALAAVRRYAAFAAGYAVEPSLVILHGLPATGKSTVARRLAEPLRAAIIRSDLVRKERAGLAPTARGSESLYAPANSEEIYGEVARRAATVLDQRRSVVVDAANLLRAERARFLRLARERGVPFVLVHVWADESTVRRRMAARATDRNEVSDATLAVYERLRVQCEPPTEVAADRLVTQTSDEDEFAALTVLLQSPHG